MVDLRPLLFLNVLVFLMFLAAGFKSLVGVEPSDASVVQASTPVAENTEPSESATQPADPVSIEGANAEVLMNRLAGDPLAPVDTATTSSDVSTADSVFMEAATAPIETTPTTPETVEEAETASPNRTPAIMPIQPSDMVQEDLLQENMAPEDAPQVLSAKSTPNKAPTTITGRLTIQSNVTGDTVLINGKPYGSTKLEVELTPGTYSVEVAKDGHSSWSTKVEMRPGLNKTLKAQLNLFNNVDYKDGIWRNNVMTGEGTYSEKGVMEYTGSFVNGKFHGSGSARYATGLKYQGGWAEGKMQGNGTLTTPEGDTYVGEMADDKFNGEGTLTKSNGDIYAGFWLNGSLNGQGTLTTKAGMLYVGGFANNQFHGNGTLTYPDGGYYEGSFSNGLYHGKGTEVYANGRKYVGQFIEGLYHGKGELMNPNGSKISGTFKNGEPFGQATLTTAEGEVFTARSSEPGVCYRLKSYRATECPKMEGW